MASDTPEGRTAARAFRDATKHGVLVNDWPSAKRLDVTFDAVPEE